MKHEIGKSYTCPICKGTAIYEEFFVYRQTKKFLIGRLSCTSIDTTFLSYLQADFENKKRYNQMLNTPSGIMNRTLTKAEKVHLKEKKIYTKLLEKEIKQ